MKNLEKASSNIEALIARMRAGDESAAWEIVERYGGHIRAIVRRRMHASLRPFVDSEDFVQSVWGSLIRIGPRLQSIDSPEQLVGLLVQMAKHKVIDEVRRRKGTQKYKLPTHGEQGQLEGATPIASGSRPPSPSQYAIARERWQAFTSAEPSRNRKMVELRLAGNTYREIAATLEVDERTVRRTFTRLIALDKSQADGND